MKRGFSLVELMVVVTIIVIVSLMIIPNYRGAASQFALERSAHKLSQDIRRASEMAMSAREICLTSPCPPNLTEIPVGGYGIFFDIVDDNKKYKLYAEIDPLEVNEFFDLTDTIIEEIELEKGVYIQELQTAGSTAQQFSVHFRPPSPTVRLTMHSDTLRPKPWMRIVLALENDQGKQRKIRVEKSGLVDLE